jgi:hypothetical protein
MNLLLANLAALLAPDVKAKNKEQATKLAAGPDPMDAIVQKLHDNYNNRHSDAAVIVAEIVSLLDPKYANVFNLFQAKINGRNNKQTYEAFSMLTSLRTYNHTIPQGEPFLVTHGKQRHCLDMKGQKVSYNDSKDDARLATDEEIARYFSSLTDGHLREFAKEDLLAAYITRAAEKMAADASKPRPKAVKRSAQKKKPKTLTVIDPVPMAATEQPPVG